MRSVGVAAALVQVLLAAACAPGPGVSPPAVDPCTLSTTSLLEDVSSATTVVGSGTPGSCTGEAFVNAVEQAPGVITFDCGPGPVTITVPRTARVFNRLAGRDVQRVVIDGGGKVTLSGGGVRRILYMNTCDAALTWTTPRCDDQEWPQLTVQNLDLVDGSSVGLPDDGLGGGAIYAGGGRFKAVNARFFRNQCAPTGPDTAGGAIRAYAQWRGLPVHVVASTFGGAGAGEGANTCSNGGALGSIGVSWTVLDSVFTGNAAVGNGANPARAGTPGGGSGGAIYNDGNTMTLALCRVRMTDNTANEGGGAVFYVSNDRSVRLVITDAVLRHNPSGRFETQPGVFYLGAGEPVVTRSVLSASP
jgi:hypothetical protein